MFQSFTFNSTTPGPLTTDRTHGRAAFEEIGTDFVGPIHYRFFFTAFEVVLLWCTCSFVASLECFSLSSYEEWFFLWTSLASCSGCSVYPLYSCYQPVMGIFCWQVSCFVTVTSLLWEFLYFLVHFMVLSLLWACLSCYRIIVCHGLSHSCDVIVSCGYSALR